MKKTLLFLVTFSLFFSAIPAELPAVRQGEESDLERLIRHFPDTTHEQILSEYRRLKEYILRNHPTLKRAEGLARQILLTTLEELKRVASKITQK